MKKLFVYADFNWLPKPQLLGELSFDVIRGNETYGFAYDKQWLAKFGNIFLSEDLQPYAGIQYTRPKQDIFACFSDTLPDRWGRILLKRREQIAAAEEKRAVNHLNSFDYLMGIEDAARMGGFRFKQDPEREFINCGIKFKVPPFTDIKELVYAAHKIENSEDKQQLPDPKWLDKLLKPGTSLGGARPKASVLDENGYLTVAKFPSCKDDYDIALWEHLCHVLGKKAGLNVAETRTLQVQQGTNYHILLSKRFDRTNDGKRIHFASALTLLGLTDGDNASTGHGYLDIVDFIVQHGCDVEQNLEELYRRVAFYIAVGNSDDHFRNHGFLLTPQGWQLSLAYDINPTLSEYQSLLINNATEEANLDILQQAADDYLLTPDKAQQIIAQVKTAVQSWRAEARKLGISQREINIFAPRFDKWSATS